MRDYIVPNTLCPLSLPEATSIHLEDETDQDNTHESHCQRGDYMKPTCLLDSKDDFSVRHAMTGAAISTLLAEWRLIRIPSKRSRLIGWIASILTLNSLIVLEISEI
ncbi:hypothetical protein SAMD00019534_074960, partial [Acytostelium subglobosum LB1]|uniref:hypothetical protein n=1 Tax=Acytostelium subglobosum LB1 TaxID=1410327 RepID=UPI0006450983